MKHIFVGTLLTCGLVAGVAAAVAAPEPGSLYAKKPGFYARYQSILESCEQDSAACARAFADLYGRFATKGALRVSKDEYAQLVTQLLAMHVREDVRMRVEIFHKRVERELRRFPWLAVGGTVAGAAIIALLAARYTQQKKAAERKAAEQKAAEQKAAERKERRQREIHALQNQVSEKRSQSVDDIDLGRRNKHFNLTSAPQRWREDSDALVRNRASSRLDTAPPVPSLNPLDSIVAIVSDGPPGVDKMPSFSGGDVSNQESCPNLSAMVNKMMPVAGSDVCKEILGKKYTGMVGIGLLPDGMQRTDKYYGEVGETRLANGFQVWFAGMPTCSEGKFTQDALAIDVGNNKVSIADGNEYAILDQDDAQNSSRNTGLSLAQYLSAEGAATLLTLGELALQAQQKSKTKFLLDPIRNYGVFEASGCKVGNVSFAQNGCVTCSWVGDSGAVCLRPDRWEKFVSHRLFCNDDSGHVTIANNPPYEGEHKESYNFNEGAILMASDGFLDALYRGDDTGVRKGTLDRRLKAEDRKAMSTNPAEKPRFINLASLYAQIAAWEAEGKNPAAELTALARWCGSPDDITVAIIKPSKTAATLAPSVTNPGEETGSGTLVGGGDVLTDLRADGVAEKYGVHGLIAGFGLKGPNHVSWHDPVSMDANRMNGGRVAVTRTAQCTGKPLILKQGARVWMAESPNAKRQQAQTCEDAACICESEDGESLAIGLADGNGDGFSYSWFQLDHLCSNGIKAPDGRERLDQLQLYQYNTAQRTASLFSSGVASKIISENSINSESFKTAIEHVNMETTRKYKQKMEEEGLSSNQFGVECPVGDDISSVDLAEGLARLEWCYKHKVALAGHAKLVAAYVDKNQVHAWSLGDSGVVLIKNDGSTVAASGHENLSSDKKKHAGDVRGFRFSGEALGMDGDIFYADVSRHEVQRVVVACDGLWDTVFPHELNEIIDDALAADVDPAGGLIQAARKRNGGDDITVVVLELNSSGRA